MLESYITPMLMGYINRYVKNIKPSDLQVSFWGGDVVLRNLELRLDVLEQELSYPLQIKSGRIRELVLHIPWNAILSKPVEIGIKDVEIVVKLKSIRLNAPATRQPVHQDAPEPDEATAAVSGEGVEKEVPDQTQQGYLQGYTNRILNNLTFYVENLVVKVIEEECDMMMSFNIQSLTFGMADDHWLPSYVCTDYCSGNYSLNKVVEVSDMVVQLHPIDSDRAQSATQREPFVRKSSFTCRMQSQYQGKKLLKKSTCILFDSPVFYADENQFSLFFHLIDWLLAMYYNGKKLKGRDGGGGPNEFSQQVKPVGAGPLTTTDGSSVQEETFASFEDVLLAGKVEDVEREVGEGGREGGSGGWGSWMWSFVATDEADGEEKGEERKDPQPLAASSTLTIMAKSVTVNFKVTHHGRVPVFSSPRSCSRTVLSVLFSGCSVRVDNIPFTQLFTVSVGVSTIQAWASGFCSCSDAIPTTWKPSSESHEKVLVFTMGDAASCDPELIHTGSLFDPAIETTPPDKQPLPLPELLLAPRPEFSAVWFTYEYYDVGPAHPCEVCEVRLLVGEVNFLLSPDTLHRVTHFTSAYSESAKACPLFTEGMVVVGDPKAETSFKITLAGGRTIVASNTHYLPSFSSSRDPSKPKTHSKIQSLPPPPPTHSLPTLAVSLARSTISLTSPMYSGNATLENPQRSQARVALSQLELADGTEFSLGPKEAQVKRIVSVPKLEIYSHSKTTGDNKVMQEKDSSYLQLHVEEVSCVASAEQVSITSFVVFSWYSGSFIADPSRTKIPCPPTGPKIPGGHLHVSVKEVELTKSVSASFTFISATVDSCGVVLLCDSTRGRLCHAIPVVCGPLPTDQWSNTDAYTSSARARRFGEDEVSSGRLLELFTAMPHAENTDKSYSTLQMSLGGLAVCVDSTVMSFVACIPSLVAREQLREDGVSQQVVREGGPQPSLHSEDTATEVTHIHGVPTTTEEGFIAKLKSYATKVEVQPILIVIPTKPLEEGLMSSELPEFPVLPALRDNTSMEALLVALPQLSLVSAKSHVLEEPVPRASTTSTLPWDCTLRHCSLIALNGASTAQYIVEPLSVTVSLADQQGGTGVTIHTDSIAVSLSKTEGELLSVCVSQVMEGVSLLLASPSPETSEDSGVHSAEEPPQTPQHHPSHLSSPPPSTITTATLPAHTSLGTASTTSSLYEYSGFSTLWIQAIVTKITLIIFASLPPTRPPSSGPIEKHSLSAHSKTSSTTSYLTPLTSPTFEMSSVSATDAHLTMGAMEGVSGRGCKYGAESESETAAKFSVEIDGLSVQFDVQEKCTDLIVKVSAVGANLYRKHFGRFAAMDGGGGRREGGGQWIPYLPSEKIFSSKGSTLPAELSEILTHSSSAAIHLPHGHTVSSGSFRNFVTLEVNTPRHSLHRAPVLKLKVQSFEGVVWLPIVGMVSTVLGSLVVSGGKRVEQTEVTTKQEPVDIGSWPAVEATIECCRLVLPSSDYSRTLLCNVGCMTVSPSLEYPTTDVRYVVSASAFRRLTHLSSEKRHPPLPAYQLDLLAVSLWGIRREEAGSAQVLLYAGSSDVRLTYTPALYWRPTVVGTSHKPAILACGHCLETNFRTDLDLILGPEQVRCVSTILRSNTVSQAPPTTTTPTQQPTTSQNLTTPTDTPTHTSASSRSNKTSRSGVPLKGLVSGTAVRLTLVSSHSPDGEEGGRESFTDSASESSEFVFPMLHGLDSTVVPLAQLQLFNLLFGVTTSANGGCQIEGSCFNMAVGYSAGDHVVCSYSDLVDVGVTATIMDSPLLETRRGHSKNTREIPPSVVSIEMNYHRHKPPSLAIGVNRPIKLTLTPHVISKISEFGKSILGSAASRNGAETVDTSAENVIEPLEAAAKVVTDTHKVQLSTSPTRTQRETNTSTDTVASAGSALQLKAKVMQFLVEFQVSTRQMDLSGVGGDRELCVSVGREEGEQVTGAVSVGEEGFLLVWDHLDLAYPNVTGPVSHQTSVTGDFHIEGLQLLSISNCCTNPVVLPTQLNCFIVQHIPSSPLDLAYVTANLSCGLLSVQLSREVVELASKVLHSISDLFASQASESLVDESGAVKEVEDKSIHFHDDLRAGDFAYVKDSDVMAGYLPQPGEVFFSLGDRDGSTYMMWHYHEPRAVTKLSILPVPFSFTSEADAPIDIEVGCTLDYWDEDREMFSTLQEFRLTETTPTEVVVARVIGSRRWRISIVEVEWEDEEVGERFISSSEMVDGEGTPVAIATILSPVLLAGGTCVDSYFSPDLVPVLDLSLACHEMQATLVYISPSHSGWYDGVYGVVELSRGPQELLKLHVQHLTCHLKQTRNTDTTFQVDGELSVEFVDFFDLAWRTALHPTHLHLRLHRHSLAQAFTKEAQSSSEFGELCDVCLKCSPAVVRFSQGLLHTSSITLHTWGTVREGGEGGEGSTVPPVILNHFILCNNTLQDIHFGQVSTDEVTLLRSRQCIGYSWRNTRISPQSLHLCVVTDGEWRWTKPFSIAEDGSRNVEVYIGRHTAVVNVCVTNIGGLQKKVTLTGNWTFVSFLPFPLYLAPVSPLDHDTATATSDTESGAFEPREMLLLPPKSSLPSLVVPETQLCGVRVRSPQSSVWSEVYPIHSTDDDWSKPQLLTEMEYCSGQRVNLWYNIKPTHTSKKGPSGSQITFSPLFAVCNHLPFDLTMVATETNASGPAPTALPECVLGGEGVKTTLCGLRASTWYHLSFKQNGCEAVSEPTVSLSTFLLVHLPFSSGAELGDREGDDGEKNSWPYEDDAIEFCPSGGSATSSIDVTLPLANGFRSCLHAVLERDPVNTITLHLLPNLLVINRSSITLEMLTRIAENSDEHAEGGDGPNNVISTLHKDSIDILPQNKFQLIAEREGKTLLSQPLIARSDKSEKSLSTNVILTETESTETFGVFGNLTIVRTSKGPMVVLCIKPTYVFHNSTPHDLQLSSSLFRPSKSGCRAAQHTPLLVESVPSQATRPLPFCEHREMDGSGGTVQALVLRTSLETKRWSLPLSSDFIRHSFALPTSDDQFLRAVLTMHEHSNTFYMVASLDPAPRLLVQNHTQHYFEIVEDGAAGIHSFPQVLPPAQEVVYEPPTFAKQYPIVFDAELSQSEGAGQTQGNMMQVAVKLGLHQPNVDGTNEEEESVELEWSDPFRLCGDSDRVLLVPGGESVLVSTHRMGTTLHLTLLPTGQAASLQPVPSITSVSPDSSARSADIDVELRLEEVVVCFDDETTEHCRTIEEILQVIVDGAVLQFSGKGSDGSNLKLILESFHINNMMEREGGDFAVTVIPRTHHARRASLIDLEPTPLASVSVHYNPHSLNMIELLHIAVQPLTLQLEDELLNRMKRLIATYSSPALLVNPTSMNKKEDACDTIPQAVLAEAERDVVPLAMEKLVIESAAFYLNARISLRVLLSCNDSPFRFSRYELHDIYSNWSEVSQTVASRYIMSTIAHTGWLVGSLELIGSPGTFIQHIGRGLRDLVTLPYQGLTRSPTWFLLGIGQGTMSFVHHLSSGALGSVTSMASSISHNMERLSLDPHHVSYQTQQRQERPATHFTVGLVSGASSFGLSLVSAVAGIVEQPMQSYHQMEGPASPSVAARSILKGVGKGLLGAVTKPVGGVMELVSQTGQGLMHGTGLAKRLSHKPVKLQCYTGSVARTELQCSSTACVIKLGGDLPLLLTTPVTYAVPSGSTNPALLLLSRERIYLLDSSTNTIQQTFSVSEYTLQQRDSQTGNLEEVEIEIVPNSQKSTELPSFHKVEYFLRQSCEEETDGVESSGAAPLPLSQLAAPPTLDWSDPELDQEMAPEMAGVKLLIPTHHAAQLVSFFNSLSHLSLHPHTAFGVHRTVKSESFFSAISK